MSHFPIKICVVLAAVWTSPRMITREIPFPLLSSLTTDAFSLCFGPKSERTKIAATTNSIPTSWDLVGISRKKAKDKMVTSTATRAPIAVQMPWFKLAFAATLKLMRRKRPDINSAAPPQIRASNWVQLNFLLPSVRIQGYMKSSPLRFFRNPRLSRLMMR